MKPWFWLAAGLIWLIAIFATATNFFVGIGIETSAWISERTAIVLSGLLMRFLYFGWTIPLAIGLKRLIFRRGAPTRLPA